MFFKKNNDNDVQIETLAEKYGLIDIEGWEQKEKLLLLKR